MQKNKIFISYRQSDTQSEASRLKENLEDKFGAENVFFDIETLEPGLNFAKAIEKTIRQSAVVLVLIGETWTEVKDDEGNLRLFKEDDWVRKEVALALEMEDTRVIPVLVKDAKKLSASQLPDNIKSLADYQWAELTIPRWRSDVEKLIASLEKIIPPVKKEPEKKKVILPPPQPKSWWAKNYLWVLGIFVVIIIIASLPDSNNQENLPIESSITTVEEDEEFNQKEIQRLRENNPTGTEIYNSLELEEEVPPISAGFNYSGKWWVWENGIRSGYFLISQNGNYFNFEYYYFDEKVGEGTGEYNGTYLYSTAFNVFGDTNQYGFTFGSYDQGKSWEGQTFVNGIATNASLIHD
jgi:hypothetical protein